MTIMKLAYFILIIGTLGYNLNSLNNKKVYIHLEKFNEKYNLLHIGISFQNYRHYRRYDFRAFNEGKTCITTDSNRRNLRIMFPDIYLLKSYNNKYDDIYDEYSKLILDDINNIYSKTIFWGITNKTFNEITEYEKTINKKYKLGLYDCRHYVNNFTDWCLNKPTPIWKLKELWDINI